MTLIKCAFAQVFLALIFFCFLSDATAQADNPQLDSLYQEGLEFIDKLNMLEDADSIIFYLEKAIPYFKQSKHWQDYIGCLNWVASAHFNEGNFADGRKVAKEARDAALDKLGESSPEYRDALSILAVLYDVEGGSDQAINLNRKVIDLALQNGESEENLWNIYLNLGYTYKSLGDYDQALVYFERSKNVWQSLEDPLTYDFASILYNLAECYRLKGAYTQARSDYQQALSFLQKMSITSEYLDQVEMDCYNGLASVFLEQGDGDSVLFYTRQAIALQKSGHTLARSYESYLWQSKWHLRNGAYQAALRQANMAKQEVSKAFVDYDRHPEIANAVMHIANVYAAQKQYEEAIAKYEEALRINSVQVADEPLLTMTSLDKFINPLLGLDILSAMANSYYQKSGEEQQPDKSLAEAYKVHKLCDRLIANIRRDFLADGSKNILAQKVLPLYERAVEVALTRYELTGDQEHLEAAFQYSERNKAILLYENQKEHLAVHQANLPTHLLEKEQNLRFEINQAQKLLAEARQLKKSPDENDIQTWENQLFATRESYRELIAEFEQGYPDYYQFKYQEPTLKLSTLQQKLQHTNTALLEYLVGEQNIFIFVVATGDIHYFQLENKGEVLAMIKELRTVLVTPPTSQNYATGYQQFTELAAGLYQYLVAEPLNKLPANITRLAVIPDDILWYLPFEVLIKPPVNQAANYAPEHLDYLLKHYSIGYHYSASFFLQSANTESSNKEISFLGMAPSFKEDQLVASRDCNLQELYQLQCSEEEVAAIQEHMGGEITVGKTANLELFRTSAPNSRIIHLATHACVVPEQPGLNKIFFANDFLSVFDLSSMELNADLAVLSACNTGVGTLVKGEGIMSLTRGFFLAGCKSVLTSLWSVDDCNTSTIMELYYGNLSIGQDKDFALRNAKLTFLLKADKVNRHPYYWAPFVQLGDAEALTDRGWKWYWLLLLAVVPIVFLYWLWRRQNSTT